MKKRRKKRLAIAAFAVGLTVTFTGVEDWAIIAQFFGYFK